MIVSISSSWWCLAVASAGAAAVFLTRSRPARRVVGIAAASANLVMAMTAAAVAPESAAGISAVAAGAAGLVAQVLAGADAPRLALVLLQAAGIGACLAATPIEAMTMVAVWIIAVLALNGSQADGSRWVGRAMMISAAALAAAACAFWIPSEGAAREAAGCLLVLVGFIAAGLPPFHVWPRELFRASSLTSAALALTPMTGPAVIAAGLRSSAPPWCEPVLMAIAAVAFAYNALAAACRRDARGLLACLTLAQIALSVLGASTGTELGMLGAQFGRFTGLTALFALCVAVDAIERRIGRVSLDRLHGLHPHMPVLGGLVLLAGFGAVGLPGTMGFLSLEPLLTSAARRELPLAACVAAGVALGGVALLRLFFAAFGGPPRSTELSIALRPREAACATVLAVVAAGGTLWGVRVGIPDTAPHEHHEASVDSHRPVAAVHAAQEIMP